MPTDVPLSSYTLKTEIHFQGQTAYVVSKTAVEITQEFEFQ